MSWITEFAEFINLSPSIIGILILTAFAAGYIDAIAGGGGLLTVPVLLSSGMSPHVVLGTNKLAATFGSLMASYTFYKRQLFSPSFWKLSFISTAVGAIAGTIIVSFIDASNLNKILPIFIGFSAIYALFNRVKEEDSNQLPTINSTLKTKQISQGLTLGFYDGFAGPGTGAFWTVSNLFLYRLNILLASGVARTMNFISNIFSLIAFIYLGYVNFTIGLLMGGFLMLGSYSGARSAIKYGNKFIRPVFTIVVSCMAVKLAFDAWSL
ncbi:TSUP family transporter [Psychrosphaera sp. F3M07]|uniref:TSUP family transporter n=1 Tax=Psychrosphaera sp. F3M07 TaxID=2841560 RepID=UPI00353026CB